MMKLVPNTRKEIGNLMLFFACCSFQLESVAE